MSPKDNLNARAGLHISRKVMILLAVFLVAALLAGGGSFVFAQKFFAETTLIDVGEGLPPVPSAGNVGGTGTEQGGDPVLNPSENVSPAMPDPELGGPTPEPWNGSSRVTVLVMGLDYRDWSEGVDIPRTDTMILFSIDPLSKTAGMFSIPRDMWVPIPGFGYGRINGAYRAGEAAKLPGGGPALAMKTVENFLGVPVNYYALIDFNAFVKFFDELGGLDMHIREEIVVDPIGPGNTVTLEPGVQTLDGATVLAYARQRYTQDGDFDRSKRQQEVIMALREQILTFNQLPSLVAKAPKLYESLSSGIHTNLTLDQVIQLAWLATQVKEEDIKQGVLDPHRDVNYASVMTDEGEAQVLVPNPDQIRILRDEVFALGGPVGPAALDADLAELMRGENARVVVNNGTLTAGVATRAGEILRGHNVNVVAEGNAAQAASITTIVDHIGKPYTIRFIAETLGLSDVRVVNQFDPTAASDIEVILGNDWASQNP
ncbi:MAG: LCP family protein [Chloroflexi bacterium]|nr:LCP family protein [Chloroflexota bacterium]